MRNVTLSIDDSLLERGREYAREHGTSFNALVRELVSKTVQPERGQCWINDCFDKMDRAEGRTAGRNWTREELYER